MASRYEADEGRDQPYLESNSKLKCLIKVLNSSRQLEVMFMVIDGKNLDYNILWRREFPA